MNDFGDAVGTAASGALLARAAEPDAGEGALHAAAAACLNCGTALIGPHCHACGQKARVHRTIAALLHDLLHGALHFEGKIWRTLPLLAWRPGELTRRYIQGERARFVSPMALFLFSVFLMFAVFQAAGVTAPTDLQAQRTLPTQLAESREQLVSRVAQLETAVAAQGGARRETVAAELAEARAELRAFDQARTLILDAERGHSLTFTETGIPVIDGIVSKWRENPGLMLYKLQANSYKFSWALIPLSIPFVWLLFAWRRRFRAYDHAIFVTYSLSFMSLLFIALSLVGMAGLLGSSVFALLLLIPPVHLYWQLRGAYGLSRFSALWRLAALFLFIWVVLALFLQFLLIIGGV